MKEKAGATGQLPPAVASGRAVSCIPGLGGGSQSSHHRPGAGTEGQGFDLEELEGDLGRPGWGRSWREQRAWPPEFRGSSPGASRAEFQELGAVSPGLSLTSHNARISTSEFGSHRKQGVSLRLL